MRCSTTRARATRSPSCASTGSGDRSANCWRRSRCSSARGIDLLSLEEKIDTASAAGELVFHVFGAIAHFERRLIAERTKDGIAAARARGKRPGPSAARCRKDRRSAEAGAGRPVANRRRQAGRLGTLDRLSRSRPRRHRALPAPRLIRSHQRVREKFDLSVVYLTTDAMTSDTRHRFPVAAYRKRATMHGGCLADDA